MSNGSTESHQTYTLKELVRNNCDCGNFVKDCENCEIERNVTLAVKEWLEQKHKKIGNETAFDAGQETLIQELLAELSL